MKWVKFGRITAALFGLIALAPIRAQDSGTMEDGQKALAELTSDYREKTIGIVLPPSAEELLLARLTAKKVVDLQEMYFSRTNNGDYLAVKISLLIDGEFEGTYHQSFVFEKDRKAGDWSKAKLYYGDYRDMCDKSPEEFKASFTEVVGK